MIVTCVYVSSTEKPPGVAAAETTPVCRQCRLQMLVDAKVLGFTGLGSTAQLLLTVVIHHVSRFNLNRKNGRQLKRSILNTNDVEEKEKISSDLRRRITYSCTIL
jgi:hypothetical protein